MDERAVRRASVRRRIFAASALVVVAGAAVLIGMNPREVVRGAVANPFELLDDPGLATVAGPWTAVPGSPAHAYEPRRGSDGGALLRGTVRQDVPLTPVNGRAYRFAVHVRSGAAAGATGFVRLQTACATGQERAESRFEAGRVWSDATVTLVPQNGAACSLRVEIAADGSQPVELQDASLVDAVLRNPSFELGAADWLVGAGGGATTVTARPSPASRDGGAVGVLRTGAVAGTVVQDVVLDPSSEAVLGRATLFVRSAKATAITLRVWEPCGTSFAETKATAGPVWTEVSAAQRRAPAPPGAAVVPDPPVLIRPSGPPCRLRVELGAPAGAEVELDAADLELRSYQPTKGSPLYLHNLRTSRPGRADSGSSKPTIDSRDAVRRSG